MPDHKTFIPLVEYDEKDGRLLGINVDLHGRQRYYSLTSTEEQLVSPDLVTVERGLFNEEKNMSGRGVPQRNQLSIGYEPRRCHYHSADNNTFVSISNCDGYLVCATIFNLS